MTILFQSPAGWNRREGGVRFNRCRLRVSLAEEFHERRRQDVHIDVVRPYYLVTTKPQCVLAIEINVLGMLSPCRRQIFSTKGESEGRSSQSPRISLSNPFPGLLERSFSPPAEDNVSVGMERSVPRGS